MDYEKKYKEAIKKAREWYNDAKINIGFKANLEILFPELKESEDERIRKAISQCVEDMRGQFEKLYSVHHKDAISWLEKQGKKNMGISEATKQKLEDNLNKALGKETPESWSEFLDEHKPTDKVEPKFKVGDWVVYTGYLLKDSGKEIYVMQVASVEDDRYNFTDTSTLCFDSEKDMRSWTIQDAKAGDVLCNCCEEYDNPLIFILKKFERVDYGLVKPSDYSSYCFLTAGDRQIFKEGKYHHEHNIKPATKEQRDLLFQKMKEAGYEWDAEKKELKKIEQKGMNIVEEDMTPFQKKVFCIIDTTIEEEQGLKQVCDELLRLAHDEIIQKSAWSEEDEIALGDALWCCKQAASIAKDENDMGNAWYAENWLKSLKDRILPQQKQEWSEEDSNMLQSILDEYKSMAIEKRNWLKSLKDRYTWKPSDEQMEALKEAVDEHFDIDGGVLWHLYEQLKKLRDE